MMTSSPQPTNTHSRHTVRLAALKLRADLYQKVVPLRVRVARLFMVLASDSVLQWCRGIFGLFLLQGVEGMPAVDPDSSLGKALARKDRNLSKYMGNSWAGPELVHFKNSVLKMMAKRVQNPALQLDVLSDAFENLLAGHKWQRIDPSLGLAKAKNFVLTILNNTITDNWRSGPKNEDSLTFEDEDGGSVENDIPDFEAEDLGDMIDLKYVMNLLQDPKVIEDLKAVNIDAPLYLQLILEGHTQKDILGNPPQGIPSMLPHWTVSPGAWASTKERDKTTKILQVLRNHAMSGSGDSLNFLEYRWIRLPVNRRKAHEGCNGLLQDL